MLNQEKGIRAMTVEWEAGTWTLGWFSFASVGGILTELHIGQGTLVTHPKPLNTDISLGTKRLKAQLVQFLEYPHCSGLFEFKMPPGTLFQQTIWRVLRSIPQGEKWSYGQVASQAGYPRAARAVGSVCRANRLAILIPCHRVICGDGGLGGYRWGREMKSTLLQKEAEWGASLS